MLRCEAALGRGEPLRGGVGYSEQVLSSPNII
jgi:hypothetical protein